MIIADKEDIYYSKFDDFIKGDVNTYNIGLGLKSPHLIVSLKELKKGRLIFASNGHEGKLISWNINF